MPIPPAHREYIPAPFQNNQLPAGTNDSLENIHFIHIAHVHVYGTNYKHVNTSLPFVTEAINSQLKVAKIIRDHPGSPLLVQFGENDEISQLEVQQLLREPQILDDKVLTSRYNYDTIMSVAIRKIFPQGLPTNMAGLTDLQRQLIYSEGASRIMLYLGELPTLYKGRRTDQFRDLLDETWDKGCVDEAVDCIKELAIKFNNTGKSMTFLGTYLPECNFSKYKGKEKFSHSVIYTTEWTVQKGAYSPPPSLLEENSWETMKTIALATFCVGLGYLLNKAVIKIKANNLRARRQHQIQARRLRG